MSMSYYLLPSSAPYENSPGKHAVFQDFACTKSVDMMQPSWPWYDNHYVCDQLSNLYDGGQS